jgi:hypothetical protein
MTQSPIVALKRYMTSRQLIVGRLMPVLLGALALGNAGWAATPPAATGTALTATTNPSPATSGQVVTLTAKVTITAGGTPAGGNVTFTDMYDSANGSGTITEVLGTVQVQSASGTQGTAILATEIGGVGNHNFVAIYNGTPTPAPGLAASTSATVGVNFSGPYSSATSLAVTGTAAPYTLTGTVSAFGPKIPTGSVTFTDATSGANLGAANLTSTAASQFTPFTSYPLASLNDGNTGGTNGPAIGDFNGDGRPDYAVPANSGSVFILLGKGDGTFTNGTTIATASPFEPTSVVVGDFNGDGKQDLAVLSANGIGSVNIYLGNGDGTFGTPTNIAVATATSGSRLLAVGDFNGDGIQDLVATNATQNNVAVLLGKGDGTFKPAVAYALGNVNDTRGQAPWNVVVGDLDGDGNLDLAVASDVAGSISILLGNGDGTFKAVTYVATGATQVGSVAVADFNHDGKLDLATTSAPDNTIYILLNNTANKVLSFQAPKPNPMAGGPYYLTIADFDRNGRPDIISANNASNNVGVLIGNGDGTFQAAVPYAVGAGSIFANVGDINGDDRVDLTAVTNTGLSVLLSGQAETATLSGVTVAGCAVQSLVATYGGDGNYATSTSPSVNVTNGTIGTTLGIGVAPAGAAVGAQITLTATLSPSSQGSTTSNGDLISFFNGTIPIGTAPLSGGVAVLNYVLPSGNYSFHATFPGDCSFVNSNSTTVSGTALQASTLSWATPAPIPFGTKLGPLQQDATDAQPGNFVYSPGPNTVLPAGTQTLSVTFTPFNHAFGVETATVQLIVQPATTITWPQPTPITFGTPLTGFQLDATASTGVVQVPLSKLYNVSGIYSPNSVYSTGGFDNDGFSYSTTSLGSTVVWNGLTFAIGPPNAPDAVATPTADPSCRGGACAPGAALVIPLPTGNYSNLYMLGAMVNNIAATQQFIVTYSDGSTLTFTQNMSDWFNTMGWPGESVINCSEDRNFSDGTNHSIQPDSACVFGYQIPLDPTKTVVSVQLPGTRNIVMLSMDLTTPSIPGTYTYTPPAGTIEPVGTDTLSVVFTPTDPTHFQSASATVQLVVDTPPTPIVTTSIFWPTPAPVTYGTPLSATQLDATAMGLARPTPVVPVSQVSVIATSTNGSDYNQPGFDGKGLTYSYNSLNNGQVNYLGVTYTLGQPNIPDALSSGAVYSLGAGQGNYENVYLIGAAITAYPNAPFILTYSDGSTTTVPVNMSAWTAQASPANPGETVVATNTFANTQTGGKTPGTATYNLYGYQLPADASKTLVSVALPNPPAPTPPATEPTSRNVVILALGFGTDNQVTVPGTYKYNPVAGTPAQPVPSETLSVSFTPSNTAGYTSATGTVQLPVTKATPVIIWPTPAPVPVGTVIGPIQLNATAVPPPGSFFTGNIPGKFVYNPVSGTPFPNPGIFTLSVTFTPTDTTDYTTATANVNLTVGNGVAAVSGASEDTDCCFFSQPTPYTITVQGDSGNRPTGTVGVSFNGTSLVTGTLTNAGFRTSAVTVLVPSIQFVPGNNNVTLQYSGDRNYPSVPSTAAVITLRNPAIPVNAANVGQTVNTKIPYTFTEKGSIKFTYSPASTNPEFSEVSPAANGDCVSGAAHNPGDQCNFNVAFTPIVPGVRKGVIEVAFTPGTGASAEPILYLFLSGQGNASQITLGTGVQTTLLNAGLLEPQSVTFSPTDINNSTLYVANSFAKQVVTLSSLAPGAATPWNAANSGNLNYPVDIVFDAFGNLVVADFNAAKVFSFNQALAESTISTGIAVGAPGAIKVDLAGDLFIADDGTTPQVIMVPGETFDTTYKSSVVLSGASVSYPQALQVDNTGANLFVGDGDLNTVTKIALNGSGTSQVAIAPCGPKVTPCAFNAPTGFAFDPNGDMYVTDGTPRVLFVPANHSSGGQTLLVPMTGLVNPTNITLDGTGNLYVTDFVGTLSKLSVNSGVLTVTAGTPGTTTVTNTGNLPLTITALTFATGSASPYTASGCLGTAVAPGGTCTLTVTSKSGGTTTDTLVITSNAFLSGPSAIKVN